MENLTFQIRGVAPLLCHNAQLADPLNEYAKAISELTSKRKKTDADHLEIARREFHGSFYLDAKGRPVIPGSNLERMLRDAAAQSKQGKKVQAGLIVLEDALLEHDGPKTPDGLWEAGWHLRASAKVGQQRVIRTRPCFREWGLTFSVMFDEGILNARAVTDFVHLAGRLTGLGDWRPKHGRFEVAA